MDTKKLSWLALFTALAVIGGIIKVPAPVSSIAMDTFPALIAAALLGPAAGAAAGAFGHFMSALIGGFPMGPLHGIIAAEMALMMWAFGKLYRSGRKWLALLLFVFLNGVVSAAPFILFMGIPFYVSAVPALSIAAAFNGAAAYILLPRIAPVFFKRYGQHHV
ncbi:ECF transporter S component [Domibacillus indicus]|uniref:ECF transporter S component n=1 Tax=Domibacillus indicus TaxID=1437523 RepID=UPI0006181A5E|nr:ECF transporter S component [Domibacillus indicus]